MFDLSKNLPYPFLCLSVVNLVIQTVRLGAENLPIFTGIALNHTKIDFSVFDFGIIRLLYILASQYPIYFFFLLFDSCACIQ